MGRLRRAAAAEGDHCTRRGRQYLGEAVAMDDYQVNNMEVSIDEECSRILATRAPPRGICVSSLPSSRRLRTLSASAIGREGGLHCLAARHMERPADKYREIKHLGRVVSDMVHDSLDAFARMDVEAALRVCTPGTPCR